MMRPLRDDEHLDLIFTFREPRKVSQSLTLQYDKTIYLLSDTAQTRGLIQKYIQVSTTAGLRGKNPARMISCGR
jgi:ribosomal protein L30/L7E